MRVGIVALQHESNTFLPDTTTLADFERGALLVGDAIRAEYADSHHEVGGFFAGLAEQSIEAAPIFVAWALPSGPVDAHAFEMLLAQLLDALKQAGELDGLLVAPHGAGVAQNAPEMDGAWLRELRSRVGPQMPIVGTLDLHANLTETMVRATDALIGYRTNPHVDQRERGIEAARLMGRVLRGEVRPTQAAAHPPLVINIERQHTANSPCRECYEALEDMRDDHRVLSASLLLGFPYADVRQMGTSVLVVTDDEPDLARKLADDFAEYLSLRQSDFKGQLIEPQAAIEVARRSARPVCLLDMGDNVGGGSPGDSTHLLHALVREPNLRSFVCLCDPEAVAQAGRAGIGAKYRATLGGKSGPLHGDPVVANVRVLGLYAGRYEDHQPRHGGRIHYDMGLTAVLQFETGCIVMVTSRRAMPVSLAQLTSCNLDPAGFDVLVAKGVHSPVAAYCVVCPTLVRVHTPGVTTADVTSLEYHNRRKPLFPFEPI